MTILMLLLLLTMGVTPLFAVTYTKKQIRDDVSVAVAPRAPSPEPRLQLQQRDTGKLNCSTSTGKVDAGITGSDFNGF